MTIWWNNVSCASSKGLCVILVTKTTLVHGIYIFNDKYFVLVIGTSRISFTSKLEASLQVYGSSSAGGWGTLGELTLVLCRIQRDLERQFSLEIQCTVPQFLQCADADPESSQQKGRASCKRYKFGAHKGQKYYQTFIHMKPTGTPSSPALENIALPTAFVICILEIIDDTRKSRVEI